MNEDKLIELLNNMDDDLIEKEIDKLMEGVEINMNSINKKAHEKLNNNKKVNRRKIFPYVVAACLCLLTITTVYADNISEAIKSFFNKTPVYSTIVDGDAYYLKEGYTLNDNIKIDSLMVSEGNLQMEITANLSLSELGEINIIPKSNPDTIYFPGGYSQGEGETENEYYFIFMNKKENNYNIKPFKDFELIIGGDSYNVSLEQAESLDSNDEISTSHDKENKIEGVNVGAKIIEGENEKLNIQLITAFEDKSLKLSRFGKPIQSKATSTFKNLDEKGTIQVSSSDKVDSFYVVDEMDNKYKLEVPQNSKFFPVTIFETNAPKDKKLMLKLPSIVTSYDEEIDTLELSIPDKGEVTLNKELDFKLQKAIVRTIKRLSPTSAEIEFELNTDGNENIDIRSFNLHSDNIKQISAEFANDKAVVNLEFDKDIDTANINIAYPKFIMNGDWIIDLK